MPWSLSNGTVPRGLQIISDVIDADPPQLCRGAVSSKLGAEGG